MPDTYLVLSEYLLDKWGHILVVQLCSHVHIWKHLITDQLACEELPKLASELTLLLPILGLPPKLDIWQPWQGAPGVPGVHAMKLNAMPTESMRFLEVSV